MYSAFTPPFVQLLFKNEMHKTEHYLFCSVRDPVQPCTFTFRPEKSISEVLWKCCGSPESGQADPNRAVHMEEPGP